MMMMGAPDVGDGVFDFRVLQSEEKTKASFRMLRAEFHDVKFNEDMRFSMDVGNEWAPGTPLTYGR